MKRRTFCASAFSVLATASMPWSRALATPGSIPAFGPDGRHVVLTSSDLADLRGRFKGNLLVQGQNGYDAARRIWNGAFDRNPALIAQCAGAEDVATAIEFARAHDLLVAVRGGGHSLSGQSVCDGGLMIDLSPMKGVQVDVARKRARVLPGTLLGQFDRETQAHGLATTAGTVSHTGVAGLTLGGGFGRIGRKYGLACDNLIGAEVVTADGRRITASATENEDLLWGLRGGGGNFGVVTAFEYRLHEVKPMMHGGSLVFPLVKARDLLRAYAEVSSEASDDLYIDAMIVPTPDGQRALALDVCHIGPTAAVERDFAQLRKIGTPVQDGLRAVKYVNLQCSQDANYPHGRKYYIKSGFVHTLDARTTDTVVDYLESAPMPSGVMGFVHHGGAISRVKPTATAFWHRSASHSVMVVGFWDDPAATEANTRWVRNGWRAVEPRTDGFYVNELAADDDQRRVRATYGDNYERLVSLKKRFDPTNLFRLNANIAPA